MALAFAEAEFEHVARLLGQRRDIAEKDHADVLPLQKRQFIDKGLSEEMHENVDLVLRPPPILSGERVGG